MFLVRDFENTKSKNMSEHKHQQSNGKQHRCRSNSIWAFSNRILTIQTQQTPSMRAKEKFPLPNSNFPEPALHTSHVHFSIRGFFNVNPLMIHLFNYLSSCIRKTHVLNDKTLQITHSFSVLLLLNFFFLLWNYLSHVFVQI